MTERRAMRDPRRVFDLGEQGRSLRGQFAQPRPAIPVIGGGLDEVAGRQPFEGGGGGRPVQRNIGGQRGLIGGFLRSFSREKPALTRRNPEICTSCLGPRDAKI